MSGYFELPFPEEMTDSSTSLVSLLAEQGQLKKDVHDLNRGSGVLPDTFSNEDSMGSPYQSSTDLLETSEAMQKTTMDVSHEPPSNQIQNSDLVSEDRNTWPSVATNIMEETDGSRKEVNDNINSCREATIQETKLPVECEDASGEKLKSVLLCRLCAVPCQGSAPVFLFQHPPHHPEVLPKVPSDTHEEEVVGDILSMIKATLPIKVSCCDKLPKQVCKTCVERLRLSHAFTSTVLLAESQLQSLRAHHKAPEVLNEAKVPSNSVSPYDCPICKDTPSQFSNQCVPQSSFIGFQGQKYAWDGMAIKDEPQDPVEPSHEELEKSYYEMFGGQKDTDMFRTEERITLKPSKPTNFGGRRPRGRPRTRQPKVIPRGKRGRRSTQTTVERILELSRESEEHEGYGFRICSRENNPATEALTQCLLCERWFPGAAACLQHSLAEHMDCGAFLCPRCQRDDFPGDFELIQHYQEAHCPDLELYEVYQEEKSELHSPSQKELHKQLKSQQNCVPNEQYSVKQEEESETVVGASSNQDSTWHPEPMDYENLNNNTQSNEFYESQDELSSNMSELAPRSLTSHSALCEEESNSISTHGSDSNLASEDILPHHIPQQQDKVLHDKLMCQSSTLTQEDSFSGSPCTLGVRDFSENLAVMDEGCQDTRTLIEDSGTVSNGELEECKSQNSHFKDIQDDCHSQDSLRAEELCGFQEAISEKSQEVSLNGSTIQFDS